MLYLVKYCKLNTKGSGMYKPLKYKPNMKYLVNCYVLICFQIYSCLGVEGRIVNKNIPVGSDAKTQVPGTGKKEKYKGR